MTTDIKPVAWRFRIDGGRWIVVTDYAAIGFSTAESGAAPEIEELYPQSAIDTLRAEVADLRDTLQFVERWANHHGRKPCVSAENALSTIQHHPAIKAITRSYADGVVPETRDPWAELEAAIAERDALRDLLALVTAVGVTMLHHTHRDDVRKEFSEDELLRVVAISEPASEAGRSVESIYRQGFDAAIAAQAKDPS